MSRPSGALRLNEAGEKLAPAQSPMLPFTTRVSYFIQLWALKIFVGVGLKLGRLLTPSLASFRPTFTRTYPCRRHLENRVFIPNNHEVGSTLPLYLNIHGGGFALFDPELDDEFCSTFSNRHRLLVVSINYSKAPGAAFPVPTHDVVAIVQAVLEDESLPIDKSRVAIGGFSAGGNLALSASQLPELKDKIKAAVAWYPVTDWISNTDEKLKTRPYKNANDKDTLARSGRLFKYGYCLPGQDLRDPLLSVSFARKEDLPEWIFTVGAEYDMLANEAREMMYGLAGIEKPRGEEKYAFERNTYRWTLARGAKHGFTHMGWIVERDRTRVKQRDMIYEEVGEWLMKGPFLR